MTKQDLPMNDGKAVPPRCKALLLCDRAVVEDGTGKVSLFGIHFADQATPNAAFEQPMTAYLQLLDGVGRCDVGVEIHDQTTGTVLAHASEVGTEFPGEAGVTNLTIPLPPLRQPEGSYDYDVVVIAGGQEIGRKKFAAL